MRRTTIYISLVVAAGLLSLLHGVAAWDVRDWIRCLVYSVVALLASGMKMSLPGATAAVSMHFLFVLIGVSELGLSATMIIGCLSIAIQCFVKAKPKPVQVIFNVASVACSIQACYAVYRLASGIELLELPLRLVLAAAAYFAVNTPSVAGAIALTERKPFWTVWRGAFFGSFPDYLVGAAVAWGFAVVSRSIGWQISLMLLPVLYVAYRSYNLYLSRLEDQIKQAEALRAHAVEIAALHRRTIETLALAVEAKDQNTHDHLERVEAYAVEVGKEFGFTAAELEALRAAALLHDVGKIAVPEHIISKPGKLTPDEFERMKIHTVVGAEIVERIRFPYAVAPMVRSHHERWDGRGYPDGLSGEQIPIGARILSAVDCLDALASDRQYRRAMPLDKAIEVVIAESGKSLDPRVVEVLARRYVELERIAKAGGILDETRLSTDLKIVRGEAPATGFEATAGPIEGQTRDLAALARAIDACQDWESAFAALKTSLGELVPYDALAVYVRQGDSLIPASLDGEAYRQFASIEIPLGGGLSGWVAENAKSIVNGNPSVEPGYLRDPVRFGALRSALAVPLDTGNEIAGVLSLYHIEPDAFSSGHLETLESLAGTLARALHPQPVGTVAVVR